MDDYKEVDFHTYCQTCKHQSKKGTDEPCNGCLDNPLNIDSCKPMRWEGK